MLEAHAEVEGKNVILRNMTFNAGFPRCAQSTQAVAATATLIMTGDNPVRAAGGGFGKVRFVPTTPAAAGESMVIDVQARSLTAGFTSILQAPFTYDSTKAAAYYDLDVVAALVNPSALGRPALGETFRVVRTYVAGGGPTMTASGVFVDYYGDASP